MESRRSDDLLSLRVNHDKRSAGFERVFEENLEYIFLVTVVLRMLFPDERVGRDGKKVVPIFRPQADEAR